MSSTRKAPLVVLVVIGIVALCSVLYFGYPGPQLRASSSNASMAASVVPEAAIATIVPTDEPAVDLAVEPVATIAPVVDEKARIVNYAPPENAIALKTKNGNILGFFYALNVEGPYEIEYPFQSTLLVTLGKAKISVGSAYTQVIPNDNTIGNIWTDVCSDAAGCKATLTDYKAGHVGVTVVFAGFEVPADTLAAAVNNMFKPSNCGGSGCLEILVYNKKTTPLVTIFSAPTTSSVVAKVLIAPTEPYAKVNIVLTGVPAGAEVVLNAAQLPVGQEYYLSDKEAKVSIPEGGGTIIYCGTKCEIDGESYKAGVAIRLNGNASDGSTPEDLNLTAMVKSSDPNMIRVIMIYGTDFDQQVSDLKTQYPDWEWSE